MFQVSISVFHVIVFFQVYLGTHTLYYFNELLLFKVFSSKEVFPWRWIGHSSSKYNFIWPQLSLCFVASFYVNVIILFSCKRFQL